jgi:hypothetical protein
MNFYYDPILGLQYDYLGDLFTININYIPEETIEKMIELFKQIGIMPLDMSPQIEKIVNITNYKL